MANLNDDAGADIETNGITKAEFLETGMPIPPERAVLDGSITISALSGLAALREVIGNGSGSTGWVLVRQPGATGIDHDTYVQLAKVDEASFKMTPEGRVAVLIKSGEPVGEVFETAAINAVKAIFPPP